MRERIRAIKQKQGDESDESAVIIIFYGPKILLSAAGNKLSVFVCVLPGHVDSHILECGSGQHAKQLVEDGGQKVNHYMTLHRMETLGEKGGKYEKNVEKTLACHVPLNARLQDCI